MALKKNKFNFLKKIIVRYGLISKIYRISVKSFFFTNYTDQKLLENSWVFTILVLLKA